MRILAYRVLGTGGDPTVYYTTKYGSFADDPVPAGTRIYADNLFHTFVEVATANSHRYSGTIGAPWTQPTMTASQTSYGGELWALDAPWGTNDPVWLLSDGNLQQHVASGHRSRPYPYLFYNPNPLTVTSVRICNSYEDHVTSWSFWCSDNRDDWTQLASGSAGNTSAYGQWTFAVPNSGAHRYYEFRVVGGTDGDWQNLSEITLYGIQDVVDAPEVTVLDESNAKQLFGFCTKKEDEMKFYLVTVGDITPWAHAEGSFYTTASAPPGSYPLTQQEYDALNYRIADGDTLSWYADQRPYTTAPWSQPIFTGYTAGDGSVISAGNYQATYSEYPWKAMDGYSTGDGRFWGTTATTTWWKVVFPYKILLTGLVHYSRYNSTYAAVQGRYWAEEAMQTPIGSAINGPSTSNWSTTVYDDSAHPIVTDRIYFQKTGGHENGGIGEVVITARKLTYEVPQ
ncbi:MAG: hypothetical protein LBT98_03460 [Puniceicoccales bacterium]|jgi:hypothetical protein|nr:hypothetical protein [Puniceicoccales bacterium]